MTEIDVKKDISGRLIVTFPYDRSLVAKVKTKDVSTTMIYTHVLSKGGHGVRSPIDGP